MKNHFFKRVWLLIVFISTSINLYAIPAPTVYQTVKQPNDDKIEVKICGDERINWYESKDGYTLLRDTSGWIKYAMIDSVGDLVPSEHIFYNSTMKVNFDAKFQEFYNNLQKRIRHSPKQIKEQLISCLPPDVFNSSFNEKTSNKFQYVQPKITGKRKYLVVLMSYPDKPFTKTREDFDSLFNARNYTRNGQIYGSVKDFYIDNSYGQYEPEFEVIGPFESSNQMAYYQNRGRDLAIEAIEYANYYVLFDEFDNDYDQSVDAVIIMFSGYGNESGAPGAIWSHAGWIVDNTGNFINRQGKYFRRYCCFPELRGGNGQSITGMGVISHEFCHTLGAPDYYDVDYSENGSYPGAGKWCLMSEGSWNYDGDSPASINGFQKYLYGWIIPDTLSYANKSVKNMPPTNNTPVAYVLNTDTEREMYFMENRQKTGWDRGVPGHGLLIWHISSKFEGLVDNGINNINNAANMNMYPVCAVSQYSYPTSSPVSYGPINSTGTPYPGTSNNHNFTDTSTPSAKSWDGRNMYRPITEITEIDSFINFNYKGRPDVVFSIPYDYNFTYDYHYNYYSSIQKIANDDGIKWERIVDNNNNWATHIRTYYSTELSNQEYWLFLPAMFMNADYDYNLTFNAKVFHESRPADINIYLCPSIELNGQAIQHITVNSVQYKQYSGNMFKVNTTGIYYIAICCPYKDYIQLYIDNIDIAGIVGIKDKLYDDINVYPNPATNIINIINSQDITITKVELWNLNGNNLLTDYNNINEIDVTSINSGVYFLSIHTLYGIISKQITITK